MELFRHLDLEGTLTVQFLLNEWWNQEQGPENITQVRVASIFKKGNPDNQANYRPISLLNTYYKLMAAIIQKRLSTAIDEHLQQTQYGFRAHRSTIQAIQAIRRTMDKAEREGAKLGIILLDWEKAFDNISHTSLIKTLKKVQHPRQNTQHHHGHLQQTTILRSTPKDTLPVLRTGIRNTTRVPLITLPFRHGNVGTMVRHPPNTPPNQGARITIRRRHPTIR